eukprot:m.123192 g.123192  ORF g.123192 m.123192 type:complete len:354 (-) comp16244_c2_seq9:232-1293(-)
MSMSDGDVCTSVKRQPHARRHKQTYEIAFKPQEQHMQNRHAMTFAFNFLLCSDAQLCCGGEARAAAGHAEELAGWAGADGQGLGRGGSSSSGQRGHSHLLSRQGNGARGGEGDAEEALDRQVAVRAGDRHVAGCLDEEVLGEGLQGEAGAAGLQVTDVVGLHGALDGDADGGLDAGLVGLQADEACARREVRCVLMAHLEGRRVICHCAAVDGDAGGDERGFVHSAQDNVLVRLQREALVVVGRQQRRLQALCHLCPATHADRVRAELHGPSPAAGNVHHPHHIDNKADVHNGQAGEDKHSQIEEILLPPVDAHGVHDNFDRLLLLVVQKRIVHHPHRLVDLHRLFPADRPYP